MCSCEYDSRDPDFSSALICHTRAKIFILLHIPHKVPSEALRQDVMWGQHCIYKDFKYVEIPTVCSSCMICWESFIHTANSFLLDIFLFLCIYVFKYIYTHFFCWNAYFLYIARWIIWISSIIYAFWFNIIVDVLRIYFSNPEFFRQRELGLTFKKTTGVNCIKYNVPYPFYRHQIARHGKWTLESSSFLLGH